MTSRSPLTLVVAIFLAFVYLASVNLDYAPLWADEAVMANIAKNLLEFGTAVVDDGRFVMSHGTNMLSGGTDITQDLKFRYPQLTFYSIAVGFLIFGENEIGARFMSVVYAVLAMLLMWGILRKEFPGKPWFTAVALGFASFSPMVILYARSATYNSLSLFLALLLFRIYLSFCGRARIHTAAALIAVSILGFHAHYLINASFIFALGLFHLLFRRHQFDRRAWILATMAALPYLLQAAWYGYFDPETYARPTVFTSEGVSAGYILRYILLIILSLNDSGILYWPVALWFVAWRGCILCSSGGRANSGPLEADTANGGKFSERLRDLGNYKPFQYFVLILLATFATALMAPQTARSQIIGIRYFIAFAPFGAIICTSMIFWLWSRSKVAGIVLAGLILFTSIPGWPWANHRYYGNNWHWTLPAYALEFHRKYPSALAEVVKYLGNNAAQDDLIWVIPHNISSRVAFYLGNKVLLGGVLSRKNNLPTVLQNSKRKYMFIEDIRAGDPPPDWIVYFGYSPENAKLTMNDGSKYSQAAVMKYGFERAAFYRPEPVMHIPFPIGVAKLRNVIIYRRIESGQ